MATGRITVFDGSGFIGRNLVPLLLRGSATVRVAVRLPDRLRLAIDRRSRMAGSAAELRALRRRPQ
jgi:nucleoside-diphosphate-sugar epimerase